jgi:UDP-N-acetylglucosamine 2-epimerase (non-hydrolysing)
MNILIVVGARPNFMKVSPIIAAIQQHNQRVSPLSADRHRSSGEAIHPILVHTGQHYDEVMSSAFFRDLGLPKPDVHLGVGSGSHAVQTAEIMKKFEPVLLAEKPDVVVVVGDVNSTLACALVTAKMVFDSAGSRPLIAHVEAGLRSFDRTMPEEINRLVTDQLSDLLFVTEQSAVENLRNEGIASDKIHFVGNTMIDSLLAFKDKAEASTILDQLHLRVPVRSEGEVATIQPYALLTLHRPANVDDPRTFSNILGGLEELARTYPIIFPVHPRTRQRLEQAGMPLQGRGNGIDNHSAGASFGTARHGIILTEPLGYLDFLCLMKHAVLVVSDSGGIQEETTCLGIPCVTVRNNTERPVTTEKGTNIIAGTDKEKIKDAVRRQTARRPALPRLPEMWDGQAATRIVATLVRLHASAENSLDRQPLFA